MNDEAMWKRRFAALMLVRLSATVLALGGLVVGFSDTVRPGGYREAGIVLVALGLLSLAILPILLRRLWRQP